MKVRLFNKGKGWYESCSNYQNREDKAYINYHFANRTEPPYEDNGNGYSVIDLDIIEWKHGAYNGKVNMTVFKYHILMNKPNESNMVDDYGHRVQVALNDGSSDMFGGSTEDIVKNDELPFY